MTDLDPPTLAKVAQEANASLIFVQQAVAILRDSPTLQGVRDRTITPDGKCVFCLRFGCPGHDFGRAE